MVEIKQIIENEYKNLRKDLEIDFSNKMANVLEEMETVVEFAVRRKMRDATSDILKNLGHRKIKAIVYPEDETDLPEPPIYNNPFKQARSTSI